MKFEEKQFVQIRTLMHRWDCSRDLILDLISRGELVAWHPRGQVGQKGVRIQVDSVLSVEQNGYIDFAG